MGYVGKIPVNQLRIFENVWVMRGVGCLGYGLQGGLLYVDSTEWDGKSMQQKTRPFRISIATLEIELRGSEA